MEESRAFPPVYLFPEVSAGEVPDEAEVSTEVSGAVETFDSAWVSVSGRIPGIDRPIAGISRLFGPVFAGKLLGCGRLFF